MPSQTLTTTVCNRSFSIPQLHLRHWQQYATDLFQFPNCTWDTDNSMQQIFFNSPVAPETLTTVCNRSFSIPQLHLGHWQQYTTDLFQFPNCTWDIDNSMQQIFFNSPIAPETLTTTVYNRSFSIPQLHLRHWQQYATDLFQFPNCTWDIDNNSIQQIFFNSPIAPEILTAVCNRSFSIPKFHLRHWQQYATDLFQFPNCTWDIDSSMQQIFFNSPIAPETLTAVCNRSFSVSQLHLRHWQQYTTDLFQFPNCTWDIDSSMQQIFFNSPIAPETLTAVCNRSFSVSQLHLRHWQQQYATDLFQFPWLYLGHWQQQYATDLFQFPSCTWDTDNNNIKQIFFNSPVAPEALTTVCNRSFSIPQLHLRHWQQYATDLFQFPSCTWGTDNSMQQIFFNSPVAPEALTTVCNRSFSIPQLHLGHWQQYATDPFQFPSCTWGTDNSMQQTLFNSPVALGALTTVCNRPFSIPQLHLGHWQQYATDLFQFPWLYLGQTNLSCAEESQSCVGLNSCVHNQHSVGSPPTPAVTTTRQTDHHHEDSQRWPFIKTADQKQAADWTKSGAVSISTTATHVWTQNKVIWYDTIRYSGLISDHTLINNPLQVHKGTRLAPKMTLMEEQTTDMKTDHYPSVTRSVTKVQPNLKLGFFSRRLWTWDKRQTKSATVRPQICNYSATYKPLLFFQRDGPRAIAPRVTGLV